MNIKDIINNSKDEIVDIVSYTDREGFVIVCLSDDLYAYAKNEILQKGRYKNVYPYSEGLALVRLKNDQLAFIDTDGDIRIKLKKIKFHNISTSFNNGLVWIQLEDGKYAFMDRNGNLQDGRYNGAKNYSEGLAAVQLEDGQWAYIDEKGNLRPGRYTKAGEYKGGLAVVKIYDEEVIIDKLGYIQRTEKLGYNQNLDLSLWVELIKREPRLYKWIPLSCFNEEFTKTIRQTIKDTLIKGVNDLKYSEAKQSSAKLEENLDYFTEVMKIVAEKNKEVEAYLKRESGFEDQKKELLDRIEDEFGDNV